MTINLHALNPDIGMQVYMVVKKKMLIVPAVVKERLTRETIDGTITSYVLDLGAEGQREVSSSKIDGSEVAVTADEARTILNEFIASSAKTWIDEQCEKIEKKIEAAVVNSQQRFGHTLPIAPQLPSVPK